MGKKELLSGILQCLRQKLSTKRTGGIEEEIVGEAASWYLVVYCFCFGFADYVSCLLLHPKEIPQCGSFGGSLVFYAWGEPVYIVLILFSTLVAYCAGLRLSCYQKRENKRGQICSLTIACVVSLLLLGFFKYADFFCEWSDIWQV